ncbi:MAG: acetyltransferase-like isoleucine patch superfamily enzyme [Psychromonas sp.]|jgi:acetyltransferase-like isoleucine patch superfamily enzyme|uniref:acyltransferase n=1 Tax=Psychromonas sp. TaxID=1884585 RepID=UPI0039E47A58
MKGRAIFVLFKYLFTVIDLFLKIIPRFVKNAMFDVSSTIPFKIGIGFRYVLFRSLVKSSGDNIYIGRWVIFKHLSELNVGDNVSFHEYCYIDAKGGITIGNDVSVAHACSLISFEHGFSDETESIKYQPLTLKPIVIASNVWLGCGVRVLAGANIDTKTVVAANSVVKGHLEGSTIYAGIPVKAIRKI